MAVFSFTIYSVLVEKFSDYSSWEITYIMLLSGAVVFVAAAVVNAGFSGAVGELIRLPLRDSGFLRAILYQGIVCSVLAAFMSNYAISAVGVNRAATFIGVATVVSIVSGVLVLGESFTAYQIIGAVIIIAGVYVANGIGKSMKRE